MLAIAAKSIQVTYTAEESYTLRCPTWETHASAALSDELASLTLTDISFCKH